MDYNDIENFADRMADKDMDEKIKYIGHTHDCRCDSCWWNHPENNKYGSLVSDCCEAEIEI
jgi:hypothetical protein